MTATLRRLLNLLDAHAVGLSVGGALLLLVLGIGYALMLGDSLRYVDERGYVSIATNLLEHGQFAHGTPPEPTAYRAPAFPLLLAGLIAVGVDIEGLRIANFVLLAASALLLSRIALAAGDRPAAALVPFVALAYPLLAYTAGTLYPQTLAGFLLCLFLYALYVPRPTTVSAALAGLSFGVLVLDAAIYLLLLPALLLWSLVGRRPSLRHALIVCLVAGVVCLPWLARNYAAFGEFPMFGTNSGQNLVLGNSAGAGASAKATAAFEAYVAETEGMGEVARNRYLSERAVEDILADPGRAALLFLGKLANWFNVDPNLATESQQSDLRVLALGLTYLALLGLVVYRVWGWRRRPVSVAEGLTILLYFAAAAAYAIFFTRIRFRVPSDMLLVLPAAMGASLLLASLARRRVSVGGRQAGSAQVP